MKSGSWNLEIENIGIRHRSRGLVPTRVDELASSILAVGLLSEPAVCIRDGVTMPDGEVCDHAPVVIYGHHRIAAALKLGWTHIKCRVVDVDDIEAEKMEIAENLHRADLTALQRDEQVARWIQLTGDKPSQVVTVSKGGRGKESGVNAAARELGVNRMDAHRAAKVAALSPEAKVSAVELGLDNNRTALLAAAKAATPEAQVAALEARVAQAVTVYKRAELNLNTAEAIVASAPKFTPEEEERIKAMMGSREDGDIFSRIDEIVGLAGEQPEPLEAARRIPPTLVHAVDTAAIHKAATWLLDFCTAWTATHVTPDFVPLFLIKEKLAA